MISIEIFYIKELNLEIHSRASFCLSGLISKTYFYFIATKIYELSISIINSIINYFSSLFGLVNQSEIDLRYYSVDKSYSSLPN